MLHGQIIDCPIFLLFHCPIGPEVDAEDQSVGSTIGLA